MTSSFVLALALSFAPLSLIQAAQASTVGAKTAKAQPVHLSIVNLSGRAREVHIRGSVINLPIGKVVVLQVAAGECVRVFSSTDTRISREIVVSPTDEGWVLPVS